MKCQETVLLVSSLISILGSSVIIVCLVSLSVPDLFTGVVLPENLHYLESLLQEELGKYEIRLDIRHYTDKAIIVLYTISSFSLLESLLLVLGVKTRVTLLGPEHEEFSQFSFRRIS